MPLTVLPTVCGIQETATTVVSATSFCSHQQRRHLFDAEQLQLQQAAKPFKDLAATGTVAVAATAAVDDIFTAALTTATTTTTTTSAAATVATTTAAAAAGGAVGVATTTLELANKGEF